ncbi:uncharacterized protein BT62DRAFT_984993 [Guyanagaster necrorhizus]|uniref:Transcription factor IIIC 90kDa subunit N-terminal domain-containing protein n=1 Tax=Guyanagaster necrorhizus TaxID=856835 RepID=A0A9P7W1X5_9AGAR|nr:uncharacterized protein BT62DRAFT_984993 [Guyanagaster necrorhizus MCA 3950]KAG7450657.1 hypothetical protein BT62DRAFT_984993 [Guyanagaster necrorhizus MCA 3950]
MSHYAVHTALNLPTATSHPSSNCVQWSSDGQVVIATKSAVYIMTPDHGINFDTTSVIRSVGEAGGIPHVGWFRTLIQLDKTAAVRWPEYSQEWGANSLGSIDVSLLAVTISPSCVTVDAGCVVATLSSNMDLSLWVSSKNTLKGEWTRTHDVTTFLIKEYALVHETDLSNVLKAQIISASIIYDTSIQHKFTITGMSWSSQPNFGVSPSPMINGSLLVGGSRGGSVVFVRYNEEYDVQHIHTISVAEGWITNVAFSTWTLVGPARCEAHVAYAVADGTVGLVKVIEELEVSSDDFSENYKIRFTFFKEDSNIDGRDGRGVTALQWIEVPRKAYALVHCKPGRVSLSTCPASTPFSWSGIRTLTLKYYRLSVGSSPFLPVSGIQYVSGHDAVALTLFDGSIHIIHDVTNNPSWDGSSLTTQALSDAVRAIFVRSESETIQNMDDNHISGMVPYDSMGSLIWIHEASRTADFSYKHDARHQSMFMVAQIWDQSSHNNILQALEHTLNSAKAYTSPLNSLRPIFFHIRSKDEVSALYTEIIKILSVELPDYSTGISIFPWSGPLLPEAKRAFRRSLTKHLFGWDILIALRMRLSVSDYLWKLSDDAVKQEELGYAAQSLLNTISHRILRTMIRHLAAIMHCLTEHDVPFVLRMVVQSLLPGCPQDLLSEGQDISEKIKALFPNQASNGFAERCPACQTEIPLEDITVARCPFGHIWSRCSITTFILSTPYLRSCIGCTRKAFLPPSSSGVPATGDWLPTTARGWVTEELLEAVHRCLFCGNTFVSVL